MAIHPHILVWEIPWTEGWWTTVDGGRRVGDELSD